MLSELGLFAEPTQSKFRNTNQQPMADTINYRGGLD